MVQKSKKAFTLIELLISMTIFFIIVIMTYANYAYYQNIARVKIALKEISQSINETRNLALGWYQKNGINQSIAVFFDTNNPNVIQWYSYDYSSSGIILSNEHLLKEKKLQSFVGVNFLSGKSNMMIYFSSIFAKPSLYYFESGVRNEFLESEVNFEIAFRNAQAFPLKRQLKYIKNTNVVDY